MYGYVSESDRGIICPIDNRSPSHLSDVPVLSLDSDPEFECDEPRREEMMKSVSG